MLIIAVVKRNMRRATVAWFISTTGGTSKLPEWEVCAQLLSGERFTLRTVSSEREARDLVALIEHDISRYSDRVTWATACQLGELAAALTRAERVTRRGAAH